MDESWQTKEVISMPVTYEDRGYVDSCAAPHHLALRAFPTIQEDGFAISFYQYGRKASSDRRH